MNREKTAKVVSELFAPWVTNVAFFGVLGVETGAWVAAIVAALTTGIAPMAAILLMMRTGKVGDHHVTSREQRTVVLAVLAAIVLVGAIAVSLSSSATLIVVGIWSALVFLAVFGVLTTLAKVKASIHVGLWVCLVVFLALAVHPLWALALVAAPLIAWARAEINHHSVFELVIGALAGVIVVAASYFLFLR